MQKFLMLKFGGHVKTTRRNWLYKELKIVPTVQVFTAFFPITLSSFSASKEVPLI